ncbi:MAG: MBL fold metallo-hydrolase, partial [Lachnospiraceae bacterium]|nr:MBL fold metallo-hydrolase [Lachnospiraceae bacterium]
DIYDLEANICIQNGSRKLVEKKKPTKIAKSVFARLVAAGQRLVAVITKSEGMANKDLAKFADQINSLCDKWDR